MHTCRPSKSEDACLLHLRITNTWLRYVLEIEMMTVVSMDSQVETVSGPQPRRGPPPATGVSGPEQVAGNGQSRVTGYDLNICHWNAEGVISKKLEFQTFLKTRNIDACCIQETHLSPNHRFSVRGLRLPEETENMGPK